MKVSIHAPDLLGDGKIELIDFLCEVHSAEFTYKTPLRDIFHYLCDMFDHEREFISKDKTKKFFLMLFMRESLTKESFLDCLIAAVRQSDQKDVMRAKQVLSRSEYNERTGNLASNIKDDELIALANSKVFYHSPQWARARYQALKIYNNYCQCCGRQRSENLHLHVDHIIPKSLKPELSLTISNLQILCSDCNMGKSNIDFTDWREESEKEKAIAAELVLGNIF